MRFIYFRWRCISGRVNIWIGKLRNLIYIFILSENLKVEGLEYSFLNFLIYWLGLEFTGFEFIVV